ncbi:MAG: hypothetical protein WBB91_11495 [Nostocoides sp.]
MPNLRSGRDRRAVSGSAAWVLISLCLAAVAVLGLLWPSIQDWRARSDDSTLSVVQLDITPILRAEAKECPAVTEAALERATTAMTGTLSSTSGRTATFVATHWFRGGPADRVVVTADSSADLALAMGTIGIDTGRVLIASRSGEVLMCGESGAYTTELGALYVRTYEQ